MVLIGSLMPLDVYNVSSYACNDLVLNPEYPKSKVQFVLEAPKNLKPADFPRTQSKLVKAARKLKREFLRQYGVPVLLKPFHINARPSNLEKYQDLRGYYPRKYSTKRKETKLLIASLFELYN